MSSFEYRQSQHPGTRLIPVNANPAIMSVIGLTAPQGAMDESGQPRQSSMSPADVGVKPQTSM
jgi:hypothetical protein